MTHTLGKLVLGRATGCDGGRVEVPQIIEAHFLRKPQRGSDTRPPLFEVAGGDLNDSALASRTAGVQILEKGPVNRKRPRSGICLCAFGCIRAKFVTDSRTADVNQADAVGIAIRQHSYRLCAYVGPCKGIRLGRT